MITTYREKAEKWVQQVCTAGKIMCCSQDLAGSERYSVACEVSLEPRGLLFREY